MSEWRDAKRKGAQLAFLPGAPHCSVQGFQLAVRAVCMGTRAGGCFGERSGGEGRVELEAQDVREASKI